MTTTSSTESNQASTNTKLSEEAKQNLSELLAQLQEHTTNSENSNYIKFKQGQDYKVLNIDPERTHTEYVQYKENEKPTLQYKSYASELIDKKEQKWTRVREWTIAPRWAKLIIPLLLKGFLTLEVTRTGFDRNDTSYSVTPFVE